MKKTNKDSANIIASPPLIQLGCVTVGGILQWLWPTTVIPGIIRIPAGIALILLGIGLALCAGREFIKTGETPNPRSSTATLITSGPFHYTRNPLYCAIALIHTGIGITANSLWILIMLIPALLLMMYGVILREEKYLENKFGEVFLKYKNSVRRWL